MRRAILIGAAILAAMTPLACGGGDDGSSSDEDQVTEVLATVDAAIRDKDIETFCRTAAPSYVSEIGGQAKCVKGFEGDILFVPGEKAQDLEAEEIEIDGDSAKVTLTNGFDLNFVKEDGTWYLEPFAPPQTTEPAPIVDESQLQNQPEN